MRLGIELPRVSARLGALAFRLETVRLLAHVVGANRPCARSKEDDGRKEDDQRTDDGNQHLFTDKQRRCPARS